MLDDVRNWLKLKFPMVGVLGVDDARASSGRVIAPAFTRCVRDRDTAARILPNVGSDTPVTQNTRLPGFLSHKRVPPCLVTIEYRNVDLRYGPDDFPPLEETSPWPQSIEPRQPREFDLPVMERAKRYVASVPPAIAGQHGDLHTFRVCCRLTRGFALDDEQALHVLFEWNERCQPPWSEAELLDKLHRAVRYGREPIGGLL